MNVRDVHVNTHLAHAPGIVDSGTTRPKTVTSKLAVLNRNIRIEAGRWC